MIPTGHIRPVKEIALDYSHPMIIRENISKDHPEIIRNEGFTVAYVLKNFLTTPDFLNFAAKIQDPLSGRSLSVFTNQPSIQVYNAWLMDGSDIGKKHIPYQSSAGIAIESQGYQMLLIILIFLQLFLKKMRFIIISLNINLVLSHKKTSMKLLFMDVFL